MWQARIKITPRLTMPWHRDATMMHGVLSRLFGLDHSKGRPNFVLWHDDGDWHVISLAKERPPIFVTTPQAIEVNRRAVTMTLVGLHEVELPPMQRPAERLVLSTLTPLVISSQAHTKVCTDPREEHLVAALQRLSERHGLGICAAGELEVLHGAGLGVRMHIGGHVQRGSAVPGQVLGWHGSMVIRPTAVGQWLLRLAEQVGLGGLTGMGFGRVRVCEEATNA